MVYSWEKKVDKDAIVPINVKSSWLTFFYFLTNLSPKSLSIFFLRPQCYKSRILEDSTDNCIIVPTIALIVIESDSRSQD